jgi:hypothetical protein
VPSEQRLQCWVEIRCGYHKMKNRLLKDTRHRTGKYRYPDSRPVSKSREEKTSSKEWDFRVAIFEAAEGDTTEGEPSHKVQTDTAKP